MRLDSVQGDAEIDASAAQARARIVDTDPAPAIEVVPALGAEGEALGFRVDLVSERPSDRHLTLVWSTQDGTARAGSDYTAVVERTLTLAPGRTQATLAVSTLDDAVREEAETFRVRVRYGLQSAPASEAEAVEAAGTIVDDDVPGRPGLPRGVVAEVRSVFDHRVSGPDPTRIDLSWMAPAGETEVTGYRVDVSADGGRRWRVLAPLVAGTSYAHEGLRAGETRHYRVRAVGAGGVEGLPAQVVQATTGPGIRRLEVTSRPARGGVYRAGEEIVVTVHLADRWNFLEPRLPLLIGGRTRDAECREKTPLVGNLFYAYQCPGEQSSEIELSYVVQAEDRDEDGISILADTLRGGLESANASLVQRSQQLPHPGVGPLSGHEVDGRPLRVSVAGAPVVEEGEAAAFTVMLSEPAREPVTVVWSTADGTAVSGEDYAAVSGGTVTFAPDEVTATVTVATVQDALDEASETFTVRLDSAAGAEVDETAASAGGTVTDDDDPPVVGLAGVRVAEGDRAVLELTLSGPSGRPVEVVWSTGDGTASAGEDYTAVPAGTATFAPGERLANLTVVTLDDAIREGEETFVVRARRRPDAAEEAPAAVEATVVIRADRDSILPGGVGTPPAAPTEVVWSATMTVGVDGARRGFASAGGVGSLTGREFSYGGEDFSVLGLHSASSLILIVDRAIAPGDRRNLVLQLDGIYIPLDLISSYTEDPGENTYLFETIGVGSDGILGWSSGDAVRVRLLAYTAPGEPLGFVARPAGARAIDLSWEAPPVDGGGMSGYRIEFSEDGGRTWLTLAASTGSADTSYRDASVGPGETRHYRVRGISRHGNAGPPSGTASATTPHGIRGLEVTSAPALGGDTYLAGETVEVTVTLSAAAELFGASLGLALGDAVVGAACVTGADGRCRASPAAVFRHVVQAHEVDADGIGWAANALGGSAFTLGGASRVDLTHAAAGPFAEHRVDGRALTVSVSDAAAVEGGALAFALELSRAAGHAVGVTWSTADGTAVSVEDYVAVTGGTVTFAPGEVTATVTVATVQDALDEASETLEMVLEAASGGAEVDASAGRATGTVEDDDAVPEVVVSGVTVSEGEAAELALTLSGPSGRAVEVTWSTVDGTAVSGADYEAVTSGEVMFAAGETTRTVVVSTVDDAAREGEESFVVRAQRRPYAGEESAGGGRGDGGHRRGR